MITFKLLFVFISIFGFLYGITETFSCGRKTTPGGLSRGGKKASVDDWPWAASLIHKPSGKFFCGGSLIKPKTVLTAAHCIQEKHQSVVLRPEEVIVQLGITNLKEETQRKKTFQPIEIIVHEDWKTFDDRYDADIALLISEHDMQLFFISPVCLPELSAHSSTDNVVGTVIGWGVSSATEIVHEDVLREVQVVRVSQENCFFDAGKLGEISSNRTFCAAGINDGDGPCKGDSGGGFFVETGGIFSIHGIVSASILSGNCPETKHSIMTKVDLFLQWILRNVHEVLFTYEKKYGHSGVPQFRLNLSRVLREGDSLYMNYQTSISNERGFVYLSDQKLSFLPNKIGKLFPKVHRIDAKICEIKQIKRSNFENMEELKELDLRKNLIEEIQSDTFNDLKELQYVYLTHNKLKKIHPKTFAMNPKFEGVFLSHNRIQSIVSRNFENSHIRLLEIYNNLIEEIQSDAFDGADSLKWIFIQDNKIKSLHKDLFSINPQLIGIDASDNWIEQLPEGLFRNNKHLGFLNIQNNRISAIKTEFSISANYHLSGNVCINKDFFYDFGVENMNEELRQSC